ncbi:Trm112 family protein [soil metagenome]
MDTKLLEILACPICHASLKYNKAKKELICKVDRLAYPVDSGIPIMLVDKARELTEEECK